MGLAECHPGNLRPSENLIFFPRRASWREGGGGTGTGFSVISCAFSHNCVTQVSYLQHSKAVLLFYLCLYLCSIFVCICIRFVFPEAKSQGCAGRSTVVCFLGQLPHLNNSSSSCMTMHFYLHCLSLVKVICTNSVQVLFYHSKLATL